MKLVELTEEKYSLNDKRLSVQLKTAEDIAATIKKNASVMLKAFRSSGRQLYRGVTNTESDGSLITIRPDRKPVEMNSDWHETLHDYFLKYGLKATRKNGIFCSADEDTASNWGNLHVIFIKDGWSATVFDKSKNKYAFHALKDIKGHENEIDDKLKELGARSFSSAADLSKVLKQNYRDIIITGESYIALDVHTKLYKNVMKLLSLGKR